MVPWTVNAREDLARIIDMKVDGLITDYPDRAREVIRLAGYDAEVRTLPDKPTGPLVRLSQLRIVKVTISPTPSVAMVT